MGSGRKHARKNFWPCLVINGGGFIFSFHFLNSFFVSQILYSFSLTNSFHVQHYFLVQFLLLLFFTLYFSIKNSTQIERECVCVFYGTSQCQWDSQIWVFTKISLHSFYKKIKTLKSCIHFLYSNPNFLILSV